MKEIMIKQNYEAIEPSKKRMLLEKKQGLLQINLNTKERSKTIQNNGFSKETGPIKQTSREIQSYGYSKERRITSETETKIL